MTKVWSLRTGLLLAGVLLLISTVLVGVWSKGWWTTSLQAAASTPPGASVRTQVEVPASMRTGVFTTNRYLNIPPNFSIAVYARIPAARFMAVAPNGDLLVSVPSENRVALVRPNANGDPLISNFVTGLRKPHDIVFHTISGTTYVYISETNQIDRYVYNTGDTTAHDRQIVVSGLPDSSSPELGGAYGHELKNIALDSNHKLYVSIGSTCNACLSDTQSNPVRGAIYQYNADGSNGHLFARGLRNAEGLALLPGTTDLWAAVNNRDNIQYPFNDGTGNYKKVVPSYVDNHPPEEFTKVRDGGNYGWPFCNPNPDTASGLNNMPFDQDVEFNSDGHVNCNDMDRINKGIQAHSAPLGLLFLQDTAFAPLYRQGALIGLHGSWNRTQYTGYKVAYFPWDNVTQTPGQQIDLITGWLDENAQRYWGRPVDIAVDQQGHLFISDDSSGTVYKMTYTGSTSTPTATPTGGSTPSPTVAPTSTPTTVPVTPTVATTPTSATVSCRVSYSVNQWPGGFTANMSITNMGNTINGWSLTFTFPGNQRVTQGWNGVFSQNGSNVTITNASWNGTLPANGTVNPGFNGSWSGSNPSPTDFKLNGQPCNVI